MGRALSPNLGPEQPTLSAPSSHLWPVTVVTRVSYRLPSCPPGLACEVETL